MPDPSTPTPGLLHDVASTGIAELDHALGELFWGDNVVFEVADPPAAEPFYRAAAAVEKHYDRRPRANGWPTGSAHRSVPGLSSSRRV